MLGVFLFESFVIESKILEAELFAQVLDHIEVDEVELRYGKHSIIV